ncbi:TMEM175 family protein [Lacticaseibacillus brantae]|uniref:Integral membrane protein n=1 Tax=Lacticaseibacillus brantae DSM 23927 TaxID=1423727 RepID=A0A0R2AYL6_9LACO|nr:TMEM175 family protein [Lacticaseibacillus brantae]KRM72112.1 hypothetical protein FC34_GL001096 [Lacticaseibacillus brantae DSM 23927]
MSKERLITFVDAVLAIIMTILVLELEKPAHLSLQGFWDLRENFFAYSLSFFWLGAMWINMYREWYRVKVVRIKTIWTTLIMLFFSSLFPYATSIISTSFTNKAAQLFYGVIVLLITLTNSLMYYFLRQDNPDAQVRVGLHIHWIRYDIAVKIIGFALTIFVFPTAMIYSVLVTLIFMVIPQQFWQVRD